jgi:hypothetical protein
VVRARNGHDFHIAKDGDENPVGMYHTGMAKDEQGLAEGAYVTGHKRLLMYMTLPAQPAEKGAKPQPKAPPKAAVPKPASSPGANLFAPFMW